MPWYAVTDDGTARRISGLGLVIGRAPSCDLVLAEPEISRRHVLLQFGMGEQLDIVPLPGARTLVNGVVVERATAARDGDQLMLPGGVRVRLMAGPGAGPTDERVWLLDLGGRRLRLRGEPLSLGGDDEDVVIDGWPAGAARLTWPGATPALAALVDGLHHNDVALAVGACVALADGDRLVLAARTVTVVTDDRQPEPTRREAGPVTALHLDMRPTGGDLTVHTAAGPQRVVLAERRFALAFVLLRPPAPYQPGEFIPDEVVVSAVWPRGSSADRGDLNQLVFRLRADLKAAGLLGLDLVERYAKGGATRFVVDARTVITCSS
ncbi:MAG: FHA domain-containing protein [Kofleriaceae bacterium]|nr:FHA domain-containing protein [Kofleriaceae bacterium]MBP6848966.1 FHA domain-containing protein [Kofleriaceae bacterium]